MTHYFTLRALGAELDAALRGRRISAVYTQSRDELIIAFAGGGALATCVRPAFSYCFYQASVSRAKRNTVDLFPSCSGATILRVGILPYDRTLEAGLDSGHRLLLRLYGTAAGNIMLAGADGIILDAFKNRDELCGSALPAARPAPAAALGDARAFAEALRASGAATALSSLKQALPFLGTLYATEALFRAGVDPASGAPAAPDRLFGAVREVLAAADAPLPRVYDDTTVAVMELRHREGHPLSDFPSVSEAVRYLVQRSARARHVAEAKAALGQKLAAELERIRRALRAVDAELRESERAADYEKYGKLLMAHLPGLRKGMRSAELEDLFGSGAPVTIALDPSHTPVQNAEAYFTKARRARNARSETERRKTRLGQQERAVAALNAECEAAETADEIEAFQARHTTALRKMKITQEKDAGGSLPPFRVFTVAGGFEVWVGKSSSNNDLLTMRYARPHDIWFHARGASGSHTLLRARSRSEPVPKEALRAAAAIAAYYSKMRKGKTVPVAYCERKYIRKPKNAPPGTVTLEREQVLFVDPRLPAPEEP